MGPWNPPECTGSQCETFFSALYRRIAARRGAKRAVMAVARALLEIAYHVLTRKEDYRELGADHFESTLTESADPWSGGWNAWPNARSLTVGCSTGAGLRFRIDYVLSRSRWNGFLACQ
jgi:hypothetical protein